MANNEPIRIPMSSQSLSLENVLQGAAKPRSDVFAELVDSLMQMAPADISVAGKRMALVQKCTTADGNGKSRSKGAPDAADQLSEINDDDALLDNEFLAIPLQPASVIETRISINLASHVHANLLSAMLEDINHCEVDSEQIPAYSLTQDSRKAAASHQLSQSNEKTAINLNIVSAGNALLIAKAPEADQLALTDPRTLSASGIAQTGDGIFMPFRILSASLPDVGPDKPALIAEYRSRLSSPANGSAVSIEVIELQPALSSGKVRSQLETSDQTAEQAVSANADMPSLDTRSSLLLSQNPKPGALNYLKVDRQFEAIFSAKERPKSIPKFKNSLAPIVDSTASQNITLPRFTMTFPETVSGTLESLPLSLGNANQLLDFASTYTGEQDLQITQLKNDIAALKSEKGAWSFQLKPDRLGSLDVTVSRDETSLRVDLTAATDDGRAMVALAVPKLEQELRQKGFTQVEAQVSGGKEQTQNQPHSRSQSHALLGESNPLSFEIPPAADGTSAKPQSGLFA